MHLPNLYHKKMHRQNNITCIPSCGCGSVTCANPLNVAEDSDTEDDRSKRNRNKRNNVID